MKIDLMGGLLQTSMTINYKGQPLIIDKLVIDTGASHTLLSVDAVAEIGVYIAAHVVLDLSSLVMYTNKEIKIN